jgi:hypothetical protein
VRWKVNVPLVRVSVRPNAFVPPPSRRSTTVRCPRQSLLVLSLRIKASALREGVNRLSLILSADGVPFRRIAVAGAVYRR